MILECSLFDCTCFPYWCSIPPISTRRRLFTCYGLIGPTRDSPFIIPHAWTYTRQSPREWRIIVLTLPTKRLCCCHIRELLCFQYARVKNWIPVILPGLYSRWLIYPDTPVRSRSYQTPRPSRDVFKRRFLECVIRHL